MMRGKWSAPAMMVRKFYAETLPRSAAPGARRARTECDDPVQRAAAAGVEIMAVSESEVAARHGGIAARATAARAAARRRALA